MHAIYHARVAKRFSLLLLDDEEDYAGDWGVDCTRWPPEVPGNWMLQQQQQQQQQGGGGFKAQQLMLPGRLRLCTKSLFFEPDDVRVPIVRIPFADVTRLEPDDSAFQQDLQQQQQQQQQQSSASSASVAAAAAALTARRAPPAAFIVATTSVTRMRPGLQDVPYATDRAGRATASAAAAAGGGASAASAAGGATSGLTAASAASQAPKEFVWSFSLRYAKLDSLLPPAMEQLVISRLPPLERLQVRSAAAAARQDAARFDPSRLADLGEAVLWEGPAEQRSPLVREPGRLAVSASRLYFQPLHDVDGSGAVRSHPLAAVAAVARRRASLRPTGVEVFFLQPPFATASAAGGGPSDDDDDTRRALAEGPFWDAPSAFFALRREADRDAFVQAISARPVLGAAAALAAGVGGGGPAVAVPSQAGAGAVDADAGNSAAPPTAAAAAVSPAAALAAARELLEASGGWLPRATAAWRRGAVGNFDYLLLLNLAAGRSFNDLAQWPVFPWVLADYAPAAGEQSNDPLGDLSDPSLFRDLSKPVGALTAERLGDFRARYRDMLEVERDAAAARRREREEARRRRLEAAAAEAKKRKKTNKTATKPSEQPNDDAADAAAAADDDAADGDDEQQQHGATAASGRSALPDMPPAFMYGTHYSAPGYVLYWLVRACPGHMLRLQGGRFDAPDRLFCSVAEAWRSVTTSTTDVKELIPEFYMLPSPAVARAALEQLEQRRRRQQAQAAGGDDGASGAATAAAGTTPPLPPRDGTVDFLTANPRLALGVRQNGRPVGAVELPRWAHGSPALFLATMRAALEAPPVSASLHRWIDLIFGCRQRGAAAADADNVFYYLTYEGAVDVDRLSSPLERRALETQVDEFGQAPRQLFAREHPPRLVRPPAPDPANLLRAAADDRAGAAAGGGGGFGGGGGEGQQQDAGGRALALSLLNSIVAAAAPEMAREAEALARAEAEAAAAAAAAEAEERQQQGEQSGDAKSARAASADDDPAAATAAAAAAAAAAASSSSSSSRLTGLLGALASAAAAGLDAAATAPPPPPPPPPSGGGLGGSLLATLQYSFARGVTAAAAAQGAAGAAFLSGQGVAGRPRHTPAAAAGGAASSSSAAPPQLPDAATGCRTSGHTHPPPPPPPQGSGGGGGDADWPSALGERLRVRRAVRLSPEGAPLTAAAALGGGGGRCAVAGHGGLLRLLQLPELEAAGGPDVVALPLPAAGMDITCLAALSAADQGGGDMLLAGGASGWIAAALAGGGGGGSGAAKGWAAHKPGTAVRALLALPGARVASAGDDGTVRVWDGCARPPWAASAAPAPLLQLAVGASAAPVRCLAASASGQTLAAGSADGGVSLWDLRTAGRRVWRAAAGRAGAASVASSAAAAPAAASVVVNGVAVVCGGAYVAAAASDGVLSLHDWRMGGARVAAVAAAAAAATAAGGGDVGGGGGGSGNAAAALRCLASDGRLVLAGGDGGRLHLWDAAAAAAGSAERAGGAAAPPLLQQQLVCGRRAAVNAVIVLSGGHGAAHALVAQEDGYVALFST